MIIKMKKTIWKFPIKITDFQEIKMPRDAEILTAQAQSFDGAFIWALVDPEKETVPRQIEIFGTGNPIDYDMGTERKYIGSFHSSIFMWHVFERIN
jgi:hypothetical protein